MEKNTVLTLLSRLIEKGFLTISKIGRHNEYAALVYEKDYLTTQTKNFLEKVYEGDVTELISTLVHQDKILCPQMILTPLKNFGGRSMNE